MKKILVLILSLFLTTNCALCIDNGEKKNIRVGITNQNFSSSEHKSADFISENIIKIIDLLNNTDIENTEANKKINITVVDGMFNISIDNNLKYQNVKGPLLLSSNAPIGLVNLNRKGTPAKYKGMIELRVKNNNSFNIINIIDMVNYLRGVVPNEMPVSFGLEALKAQTVAARNYATNSAISPNFDVTDSTASQVYYGVNSYRDITDNAVLQTHGIYALYSHTNKPISALYFSTSPGITDDWDEVFATNNKGLHPYLKPKYDNPNQKPLFDEKDVKEFYSRRDTGLDTNSPKFRWSFEFTREELENVLHNTLQQQSKAGLVEPKYDGDIKLEGLKEIKPIKRTESGKITELLISSKTGDYKVKKELGIRRVLKKNNTMLPSANFFIETQGETTDNEKEKKLLIFFDVDEKYPEKFKLTGGGFGHGVGMSQFGAYNMAKQGRKYPEILNHYYTDIILSTMPKTVFFNEYNVWYKTEFYFDKSTFKTAYLYIDNSKNTNEFNFKINDYEFLNTADFAHNKLIKINITPYLTQGINNVNFAPLTQKNKGKIVVYQVEFE